MLAAFLRETESSQITWKVVTDLGALERVSLYITLAILELAL